MSGPIKNNPSFRNFHVLRSTQFEGGITVATKKDPANGRVHEIPLMVDDKTVKGYVTYDDYLRYSATAPGAKSAVSPDDPKISTFYVSGDEGSVKGRSPVVTHHRRPNEKQAHYEVSTGTVKDDFVLARGLQIIPGKHEAKPETREQHLRRLDGDRKKLFAQIRQEGFSPLTDGRRRPQAPAPVVIPPRSEASAPESAKRLPKAPPPAQPPAVLRPQTPAPDTKIAPVPQAKRPTTSTIYADASVAQKAHLIGWSSEAVTAKSQSTGEYLNAVPGKPNQFVTEEGKIQLQAWSHIRESRIQQPPSDYKGADRAPLVYSKERNWSFDVPAKLPNGQGVFVHSHSDAGRLAAWARKETPDSTDAPTAKRAPAPANGGRVTSADAAALAAIGNATKAALQPMAVKGNTTAPVVGDVKLTTTPTGDSSVGRLHTGQGGGFVSAGTRTSVIDAGSSGATGAGAMTLTTAAPVITPKTGNEFKVDGVEISPGKDSKTHDPLYKADLRPAGDKSEPNTLTFGQFVQTTTKGGHDVRFALTVSKDMIKSPAGRDAVRDRLLKIVDASLSREKMDEGSRMGVGMAFKERLDAALAKMAAE